MKRIIIAAIVAILVTMPTLASAQYYPHRPSVAVQARDAAVTTLAVVGTVALVCAAFSCRQAPPPHYGYYPRPHDIVVVDRPPQVIIVEERRLSRDVVVRETAPTTIVVQADPKTPGTACRSNAYGWSGVWIIQQDGSKACQKL
ncbi:MAG: hypothetical protein AAB899_01030 [Patescibacteria group bacterium]